MKKNAPNGGRPMKSIYALVSAICLLVTTTVISETLENIHTQKQRPNFLFILVDDLRFDAMGFMGHPFLKTPNVDQLRKEGVWMKNAFCLTSLCSPSRASFLTGTTPSVHGIMVNDMVNDYDFEKTPSYHQVLQKAGYQSAFIGKWHLAHHDEPRPGFDYWLSFTGQGVYRDPELNENGRKYQAKGYMTDILNNAALKWLDKNGEKPFCMYLSHKAVHQPFLPPKRHENIYKGKMLEMTPNYNDSLNNKPFWQRCLVKQWVKEGMRSREYRTENNSRPIPNAYPSRLYTMKEKYTNYYQCIPSVDDGVGKLIEKLRDMGQLDNTVIVFTGDNGYLLGEHLMGDKRVAYEESIRIPMVIRYPKLIKPGTTIEQIVLNMDIAPTFLDIANVTIPEVMQGSSMVPLFEGSTDWRDKFLYTHWVDINFPQYPRILCLRSDDWKLVTHPDIDDLDEFYDLRNDNMEMNNLINSPEHKMLIEKMRDQIKELAKEQKYRESYSALDTEKKQGLMAWYSEIKNGKLIDQTTYCNHGTPDHVTTAEGPNGPVMQFAANSSVTIAESESMDTSYCPMTLHVKFKAEEPGTIAGMGQAFYGAWSLFVDEQGIPCFGTRDRGRFSTADGLTSCLGKWTALVVTMDHKASTIYINGKKIGAVPRGCYLSFRGKKELILGKHPHRLLPIGPAQGMVGQIEEFKFYREYKPGLAK